MAGHLVTRGAFLLAGLLAGLLSAVLAAALLYVGAARLPGVPAGVEDVAILVFYRMVVLPDALKVVLDYAAMAGLPALAIALVGELLAWRALPFYLLAGAGIGAGIEVVLSTDMQEGRGFADVTHVAFSAIAGAIGGLVYWTIAGRRAGARRQS